MNVVGTLSFKSSAFIQNGKVNGVKSTNYHFATDNKIIFANDGTASLTCIGQDTCFIVHTASQTMIMGYPGDKRTDTWIQSGDIVFISVTGGAKPIVGKISQGNPGVLLPMNNTISFTCCAIKS